jgi:hypothetical protein
VARPALRVAAVLTALCLGGAMAAVAAASDPPRVVVTDAAGAVVASVPLDRGGFALTYRHSVYGVAVSEEFEVGEDGAFRMAAVRSELEAVLDYYGLEGARHREGPSWALDVAGGAWFRQLPLAATSTGRRTLVGREAEVALWDGDGPRHLTVAVRR